MSSRRRAVTSLEDRPTTRTLVQQLPGALEVPLDQVIVDVEQPRRDWKSDGGERRLDELTASIKEFGVLQPLVVRADPSAAEDAPRFLLIAGGRRREAASRAGLATVPVVVRNVDTTRVRIVQLLENIQRQALAPLDEARAMKEIMDAEEISAEELGRRLHISGQTVRDRLAILRDQVVADAMERGQITKSVGRLIRQSPPEQREEFYTRLRAGDHLVTAGVVEARKRRLEAGIEHPDRRGPGRTATVQHDTMAVATEPAAVQTSFELQGATLTPAAATTTDTHGHHPASIGSTSLAQEAVPAWHDGLSPAQSERARLLADQLAIALLQGLPAAARRDALVGLRAVLESPSAGSWATALLNEVVVRVTAQ